MFRSKRCIAGFLIFLTFNLFAFPISSNALAIQKICGYIESEIAALNLDMRSGFNVKIVGTNANAITDSNGYFEITGFQSTPGKEYNIEISKDGYLKRVIKNVQISTSIFIGDGATPIYMWAGDMAVKGVQDDVVNINDVIQIARCFNAIKGDVNFNSICDIEPDGAINIKDVIAISKHFNATSDNYESIKISPIEDENPAAPENLKSLWITGTTVSLSWSSAGSNISGYEVYCNDNFICTTTNTSAVFTGLTPNTVNVIYIKAVNSKGNRSLASESIILTTTKDDHGNTMEMATPIESDSEIKGTFQEAGDLDYFKFIPDKSGVYILKTITGNMLISKILDNRGNDISPVDDYEYNMNAGSEYYIVTSTTSSTGDYRFIIRSKTTKPDLAVVGVEVSSVSIGKPAKINVQVKNIGDVVLSGSFRIEIDIDDKKNVLWADCNAEMDVGEVGNYEINNGTGGISYWIPDFAGNHNITVHIDTKNEIDEVVEGNNSYNYVKYIDDYPDGFETAMEVEIGQEIKGSIGVASDKDYFYIIPKTTGIYQIELPNSKFTNVYLYNNSKTQVEKTVISYDARNNRLKCYVKATLNANEKYYLGVKPANIQDFIFENYTLSIFDVQ